MIVQTCLLVTDDPDDHHAFSEAASEISEGAIVLIILDSQKALHFIKTKFHEFDYIFLDLFMHEIRINSFLKIIREDLAPASGVVVYGDESSFSKIENPDRLVFFNKEYQYSELKKFLKKLLDPAGNLYQ